MRAVLVLALLVAGGVAAHPGHASRAPRRVTVHIANFAFAPADTTLAPGDTVAWINDDDFEHVVAADSAAWKSPTLFHGGTFLWVATRAGRVSYHCVAHPVMHGALTIAE
jgi:plastocyanin